MAKKGFLGLDISITSKNVFKLKKVNSDAFYHKIKRMTSLQEYLKALCFYFASLTTAWLCQLHVVSFLSRKIHYHYLNNNYLNWKDFVIPDLTSRPIQKPRHLFCTGTRSSSVGVAEAGTLKLDHRALKYQNPIFFLRIPFYTLSSHNYKNPVGRTDTSRLTSGIRASSRIRSSKGLS